MDRRYFLKLAAAIPSVPFVLQSCLKAGNADYSGPIEIFNDMSIGHLVFESQKFGQGDSIEVKTLIVGGGIAGVTAASALGHEDFILCELSNRLGGSSAAAGYNGMKIAQGAHYDLEYPDNYGEDILGFLQSHDIIYHRPLKGGWAFVDEEYVVPDNVKNRCFENGEFREDVLREGKFKEDFLAHIASFEEKMIMPTRLIDQKYHGFNDVTFIEYLNKHFQVDPDFKRGLDYHMLDDWGGTSDQVSALAGIHYFKCRPYYREIVQLFSPPHGNSYFIEKFARKLPQSQLKLNNLVSSLERKGSKWYARVIEPGTEKIHEIVADHVIYAGQKHALRYVAPNYFSFFESHQSAPWLVINLVLNKPFSEFGYWQNEIITDDITFLGFINSNSQYPSIQKNQVLTAYYCLPSSSRENLANIDQTKETIVHKTIQYLNAYFGEDITDRIETVLMNAMGHAMPIPGPGYLFNDANQETIKDKIAFAGVDHHRLPVLMEAIDSGLEAVKALETSL